MNETCPERPEGMPHEFVPDWCGPSSRLRCQFCDRREDGPTEGDP